MGNQSPRDGVSSDADRGAEIIDAASSRSSDRRRQSWRDERGFTLIELANVVMIIGVLGLMAYPAIGDTKAAVKRTSCQERQRQIYSGGLLYAMENIVPNGNMNVNVLAGSYVHAEIGECPESVAVGYDDYTITYLNGEPMDVNCDIMNADHPWDSN